VVSQFKEGLAQRLLRGLSARGFSYAVQAFIQIVQVPLLLYFWGVERFGEWLILFSIPSYLTFCDMGLVGTTKKEIALMIAQGKEEDALFLFQSSATLLLLFLSAILGIVSILVLEFFSPKWVNLSSLDTSSYLLAIVLLFGYIFIKVLVGVLDTAFYSTGRYASGVMLFTYIQLMEFVAFVVAVAMGAGFVGVSFTYLCFSILGAGLIYWRTRAVAPWLRFAWRFNFKKIRNLFKPALASMGFPIGMAMNIQGVRLVIGATLGPAALAVFATMRTLTSLSVRLIDLFGQAFEPEYAFATGANDIKTVKKLICVSGQLSLWLGLMIGLPLLLLGDTILTIWTNNNIQLEYVPFLFLITASVVNAVWFNAMKVPYSINRHEGVAMIYMAFNSAGVLACFLLANEFGLDGVAGSLLLVEILLALFVVPLSLRHADIKVNTWIVAIIMPPFSLARRLKEMVLR